jgi:hypothetical protein
MADVSKVKLPNGTIVNVKDETARANIKTYTLTQDSSDGHKITLTPSSGTGQTITIPDNNTTYTFDTGANNGQIKVTPSGGTAQNVSVKGLGSAAYTASTAYATSTVLTNQDLNNVTATGFYNAGGGNSVKNKPSDMDNFGLEVIHNASGSYYTQIIGNGITFYRRSCDNGTWSAWTQDKYTDNNTWTAMVGATSSANGSVGYVNAIPPKDGYNTKYLRADGTWTVPPNDNTKNTAGATDTSSKIFLIGATSQGANPQTYSQDTAYVGTDGCLYSNNKKVLTDHQDISGKANLASPTFTGVPKAPTATAGTNTTQIATTAFVQTAVSNALTWNYGL